MLFRSEEKVKLAAGKRKESLRDTFSGIPDESTALLKGLNERGIKTGLITNTFSDERDFIRSSVLMPYFDEAFISYEQGICKPDQQPLGLSRKNACMWETADRRNCLLQGKRGCIRSSAHGSIIWRLNRIFPAPYLTNSTMRRISSKCLISWLPSFDQKHCKWYDM